MNRHSASRSAHEKSQPEFELAATDKNGAESPRIHALLQARCRRRTNRAPILHLVKVLLQVAFPMVSRVKEWSHELGERRVTPKSYSMKSVGGGPGAEHPKSWVLEVSNIGSEGSWETVDSRKDNDDLNGSLVTRIHIAVNASKWKSS